jgi:hypothetical protein
MRQLADDLNRALIEELTRTGKLTALAWRAAFEAVPRHVFAPRFTMPDNMGGATIDRSDRAQRERWLRSVYHDEALLTDFDEHALPTTSCSAPSAVATMLESSEATDGDSVLEIGTGTGWSAGLLAQRLGSSLDPAILRGRAFAFFAQLTMPGTQAHHIRIKGAHPTYFCLTDPHTHAWARVEDSSGTARPVTQGGDRHLWNELEVTHELWQHLQQPNPADFTITLTPNGQQIVTLPTTNQAWALPL